jgi:hypothetical protein
VLPPVQIVVFGLADTVGLLLTVTVTEAVLTQPAALVPVSVYVVVIVGLATGLVQVVQDNPVAGDHTYVDAPNALNDVLDPEQIDTLLPALMSGNALTVTATVALATQPFAAVPVTV